MPGDAEQSPEDYRGAHLAARRSIAEGTRLFDEYRACALRDAERSLFLSASHYRRGLDLMIPSSSHWAQVTFYYGAWFAARALLGMFGCGVLGSYVIDVNRTAPGGQELAIQKKGKGQSGYHVTQPGTHRQFWEIFYRAAPSIRQFVDDDLSPALTPVSNNDIWLIEERNKVNYKTTESIRSGSAMGTSFSVDAFPQSLPGALNTQYRVCEGILAASCAFATQFGLATDALDALGPPASFQQRVLDLVYSPAVPDLVGSTKKQAIFGA